MIPDKRKTVKEHKLGEPIKVSTPAQSLAQKENFALFQLRGVTGQLVHLMNVPGIGTINVEKVRLYCVTMENNIRKQQQLRKNTKAADKKKGK